MADIFISYSHRDKAFVEHLCTEFEAHGRTVWVDWKDIQPTGEWLQEVYTGVKAADAFIFVISPDSVVSPECRKEINCAVEHNKRLIPVIYHDVELKSMPPEMAERQWISCRTEDDFDASFRDLIEALDRDLDYVHVHTRLLMRAIEWDKKDHDSSLRLHGNDLRDGEQWLAQSAGKEIAPKK